MNLTLDEAKQILSLLLLIGTSLGGSVVITNWLKNALGWSGMKAQYLSWAIQAIFVIINSFVAGQFDNAHSWIEILTLIITLVFGSEYIYQKTKKYSSSTY